MMSTSGALWLEFFLQFVPLGFECCGIEGDVPGGGEGFDGFILTAEELVDRSDISGFQFFFGEMRRGAGVSFGVLLVAPPDGFAVFVVGMPDL